MLSFLLLLFAVSHSVFAADEGNGDWDAAALNAYKQCLLFWNHELCLCQYLGWMMKDGEDQKICEMLYGSQPNPVWINAQEHEERVESEHPFSQRYQVHDVTNVMDKGPTKHVAVDHVHHIVHHETPGDVKVHHFHHFVEHKPGHKHNKWAYGEGIHHRKRKKRKSELIKRMDSSTK